MILHFFLRNTWMTSQLLIHPYKQIHPRNSEENTTSFSYQTFTKVDVMIPLGLLFTDAFGFSLTSKLQSKLTC